MQRYESKKNFIEWVDTERKNCQEAILKYQENGGEVPLETEKDFNKVSYMVTVGYEADLDFVKNNMTDDLLEYLNAYSLDMNILVIDSFLRAIDEIKFFKKSGLSQDGKEYKKEIERLKSKADYLQFFSTTHIQIRLPKLPHVILYDFVKYLRRSGLSEEQIKIIHNYFPDRKRLPKKSTSTMNEAQKVKKVATFFKEALQSGAYSKNRKMIETILVEELDYYIPKFSLTYFK